jgi:hypothetical protein
MATAWSFDQCNQHKRGVDGVSKIQAHSVPKRTMLVHKKLPRRQVAVTDGRDTSLRLCRCA